MIDIHMHIIPGVDDGSRDMMMSCEMLKMAWKEGVRAIIATPHSSAFNNARRVMERYAELKDYLQTQDLPIMLMLGAEVLFTPDNVIEVMESLNNGSLPTLNGSRYVLTEFLTSVDAEFADHILQVLCSADYIPVIAHVERYPLIFGKIEQASELHKRALFQINAYSLVEEQDAEIKLTAQTLLSNRLVDFIGSDAHRTNHRAPNVASGIRYVLETCEHSYARDVLWANAKKCLNMDDHQYLDGLMGLAVGDALGVPFEKCTLEEMRQVPCIGMKGNGAHNQPAGTWSDDTSMALCVADSLGTRGIDPVDVMKKFSSWKNHSQYTATGATFDVGRTCRKAIDRFDLGAAPELCGNATETGNGNGGLMRIFPIALYACRNCENTDELLNLVHSYSAMTHAHPIGLICCGFYALFIREWMCRKQGDTVYSVLDRAIELGRKHYSIQGDGFAEAIRRPGLFLTAEEISSMSEDQFPTFGYAVNTWNIAAWSLLNSNNFRDCVLKAVNLGGDTDTNSAVAGSLAGFVYGSEDIPKEWIDVLRNKSLIIRIANRLDRKSTEDRNSSIENFTGEYACLSMKYRSPITFDGISYQNLTSAWLAQGVDVEHRCEFAELSAHQARRLFKQFKERMDWKTVREKFLYKLAIAKFEQNEKQGEELLKTEKRLLIYNTTGSHDNYLGRCLCEQCRGRNAQNVYGKTLMDVREQLLLPPNRRKR